MIGYKSKILQQGHICNSLWIFLETLYYFTQSFNPLRLSKNLLICQHKKIDTETQYSLKYVILYIY